jgi:hypothetical protein
MAKKKPDIDHSFEYSTRFFAELDRESDRAAVILGVARLDLLLCELLRRFLLPAVGDKDELLEGDSPLSTFSSRISIAHRLGLIDGELTRALHLVRKIRNGFAHELADSSLSKGSHYDRVRELTAPFVEYEDFEKAKGFWFKKSRGAGREFRAVLAVLALRLEGGFEQAERITANPGSMIPGSWKKKRATQPPPA